MHSDYFLGLSSAGFHRVHYTDTGDPHSGRVVVCVHGLTRNGRDFDFLAQALAGACRVVCPDIVGRGRSDWLRDKNGYNYPQYMADLNVLINRVYNPPAMPPSSEPHEAGTVARELCWVGTSMGGLLGMLLAALPNSPIRRLVVNDIGPIISHLALARIAAYVGTDPRFKTFAELNAYVRTVSAPFGALTDAQWEHLTATGSKEYENGTWGMTYDPGIAVALKSALVQDIDLWSCWDAIKCPTLLLRGADSDMLTRETANQMRTRGPRAELVEFPAIGHAPMLMADDQIKVVKDFLLSS